MLKENCKTGGYDSTGKGKLLVVGIGPGSREDRTYRAVNAIASADTVVGYHKYLELITDLTDSKETISTGMTLEVERVQAAINSVQQGRVVALVSSGDPGVYGMAGLALELAGTCDPEIEIQIIPGITAANSAAARLGAPLMLDYCCISLSDLMIPWETIKKRIHAAGQGDFVVALYNPRSVKRRVQLEEVVAILLTYRPGTTPVGIVNSIGLDEETVELTKLDTILDKNVHMRSMVIIGNGSSRIDNHWMLTPRGYLDNN